VTLTDFLLARIAEDEDAARAADAPYFLYDLDGKGADQFAHIARHDPPRVLAECEAKRRIVEACGDIWEPNDHRWMSDTDADYHAGLEVAARFLAAIYADHPDYRQEWKP
jgi:hypothetical protein